MASFELPELPYAYDALDPHIDKETMNIHHTKHHNTYVTKLNEAIEGHADIESKSSEDLVRNPEGDQKDNRTAVRNNRGIQTNHNVIRKVMSPNGGGESTSEITDKSKSAFGSSEKVKDVFEATAK